MRIGMMVDIYKPHVSGITNHIALTKNYLEAAGHEVFVFTFGDEDYPDDEPNIIRSVGVPMVVPVAEVDVHFNVRYTRAAQELLHTMDIVHIHHPFLSGSLALRYCRRRAIPLIYTNHTRYDLYPQAYFPWIPSSFGETFLKTYLPTFGRAVDMVVTPSAGMKDVMIRLGVDVDIQVVPNGVDLQPIGESNEMVERQELGFTEQDVVFIFVGRLGPEKNIPFLLRSFAGAALAFENTSLIIIGDGPERDNLEDRVTHMGIDDRVHFTGLVPYKDLPQYLLMADAFVTASVTEVHPLTVIEAMAAGLPVLGIQSPGVGDTVIDGETGYLVPEDIAAFTAQMIKLVVDSKERKKMSKNSKKEAQLYAIERTSQVLIEKYEELIERKAVEEKDFLTNLVLMYDKLVDDAK